MVNPRASLKRLSSPILSFVLSPEFRSEHLSCHFYFYHIVLALIATMQHPSHTVISSCSNIDEDINNECLLKNIIIMLSHISSAMMAPLLSIPGIFDYITIKISWSFLLLLYAALSVTDSYTPNIRRNAYAGPPLEGLNFVFKDVEVKK